MIKRRACFASPRRGVRGNRRASGATSEKRSTERCRVSEAAEFLIVAARAPTFEGDPMLAKVLSSAVYGLDAYQVDVEVDIATGLPQFNIVGLPDLAVKESKDRVRAALKNTGFNFPIKRITVNLAPADIKKEGSAFKSPMAIGILVAEEVIPHSAVSSLSYKCLESCLWTGRFKPVKGALR